jgi:hypothetical protein
MGVTAWMMGMWGLLCESLMMILEAILNYFRAVFLVEYCGL